MSLNKRLYIAGKTTITSQNLNDIQNSIIELENKEVQQGVTSFNGQTGDVELDALLFTKQDLLADQKKQVKENLEIPDFFIINLSRDSDGSLTVDKNFNEIMSNIKAGKAIFLFNDGSMYPLTSYNEKIISFIVSVIDSKVYTFTINNTGAITLSIKPIKTSALENDAGYLTSHQSLSEYSKTTEVESLIDQKISALPKIYSGTVAPENSLGNDGDIYIQKGVAE